MDFDKGKVLTVYSVSENDPGEAGIEEIIHQTLDPDLCRNKRILVLTPDATRTCPLPMMIRLISKVLGSSCSKLDFMVALGTHTPLDQEQILELYGINNDTRKGLFDKSDFLNHRWDLPETLKEIGVIQEDEIYRLSRSKMRESVPVMINRAVFDYDLILVLGPVFPHEVVGFSGGAKYFFPGISGGEFLHFFHWLGAVMTCKKIIGERDTPVRDLINRAMQFFDLPVLNLSMVVNRDGSLRGVFGGNIHDSWSEATELSAKTHIEVRNRQFDTVLGCAPEMYDEIWTAGKVMYKLEQMVKKGGRLIIYAPHINELSRTWQREIEEIGFHVRDYFLEKMERYQHIPKGVLAHSTHVKGGGQMTGDVEVPDVNVILATSISRETCERVNLGYLDYRTINPDDFAGREEEGILLVRKAGEILYKFKNPSGWKKGELDCRNIKKR